MTPPSRTTRASRLLHIEVPVIQGGMLWIADAALASAVSNAGGLGVVSPFAGMDGDGDPVENLRREIRAARSLTSKIFGVNIPLDLRESGLLVDAAIKEKAAVVITSSGDPGIYTDVLHSSGARVLHVVGTVDQALKAERVGVDALIAEGCEAGGHLGVHEIPLFSLLPQVVDAVSLPVIAAGGIADGRGLAAALCLGAEGVQMGTRFIAVKECPAHPRYKNAVLSAKDTGTVITARPLSPARSLNVGFAQRLASLEASGASAEELRRFLGFRRARKAQLDGELDEGECYAGASAGLIREIVPAAVVVREMAAACDRVLKDLCR